MLSVVKRVHRMKTASFTAQENDARDDQSNSALQRAKRRALIGARRGKSPFPNATTKPPAWEKQEARLREERALPLY